MRDSVFQDVATKSKEGEFAVTIPKFKVDSRTDMIPTISKMGGSKLFKMENDFGLMSHEMRYKAGISQFLHVVQFETDEMGSRGAAATAVNVEAKSAPNEFIVDRPFLFYVWETNTHSILFLGVVNDPSR